MMAQNVVVIEALISLNQSKILDFYFTIIYNKFLSTKLISLKMKNQRRN